MRMRARVVLHAARRRSNTRIARETGLHLDAVRTWRDRFAQQVLPGLADPKRTGRPPTFSPLQAAQVKALACQLPAESGVPLSCWSVPERCHPTLAPGRARAMRVNHTYGRGGALALSAGAELPP